MPASRLAHANALAQRGISTIPINPGTKKPTIDWGEYATRIADVSERYEWFAVKGWHLAVVTGPVSGNLVILDYDGAGGFESHAQQYPVLRTYPRVRTGSGKHHVWLRTAEPVAKYVTTAPDGSRLEVRSGTHYCLCPPSLHPNGENYRWEVTPERELPTVELESIGLTSKPVVAERTVTPIVIGDRLTAATRLSIAAALAPHWVTGARKDLTLGVAGWLAHHGTPERDAQAILTLVVAAAEDDSNLAEIYRFVSGTYTRATSGEVVAGWSLLRDPQHPLISAETATLLEQIVAGAGRTIQFESSVNLGGDFASEVDRWRHAYDRMRDRARRLNREVAQLLRLLKHHGYRGRGHVVEAITDWLATARPEPDGSIRLVKEAVARTAGCSTALVNDALAPAIARGGLIENKVTTYDEDLKRPTTRSYVTMPGITRTDDRQTNRADVRARFLDAPNHKRVGANGFTQGGTRPNAGRRVCPTCGALAAVQQTRRATAHILDCGHTLFELGEPIAAAENAHVHSVWDQYRERPLTLPDGKTGTLLLVGVTPEVDAGLAYVQVVGEPALRRLTLGELDAVTHPRRTIQIESSVNFRGDSPDPDTDWMDPNWEEQMERQTLNS